MQRGGFDSRTVRYIINNFKDMDSITFSRSISTGTRVYYVDAHIDRKGQPYMSISEIPTGKMPDKKKRQRIFLHVENLDAFAEAFAEVAAHIKHEQPQR